MELLHYANSKAEILEVTRTIELVDKYAMTRRLKRRFDSL